MSKRLVAVGAVLVLLLGVFLTMGLSPGSGTALAATTNNSPSGTDAQWIFFPWVPNGEKIGDTGPWYGSVIIQNIEDSPVIVNFGKDASGANFTMTATIQPHASYIYSAAALGLPNGGGGVAVQATWSASQLPSGICQPETTGTIAVTRNGSGTTDVDTVAGLPSGATITQVGTSGQYTKGVDYKVGGDSGNQITWISTNRPALGSQYPVTYGTVVCSRAPEIAGLEKQATPATSGFGDQTSNANTIVDGYAAVPMQDVAWGPSSAYCQAIQSQLDGTCNDLGAYFLGLPATMWGGAGAQIHFDGHSYLPIVQNNWNSWDSFIHVTNVDASTPNGGSQVTVQFFSAGQGVGNTAVATYQTNVAQGATVTIDVAQALKSSGYSKDSFVGSAWITSDYGVVTSESRVKSPTSMLLISNAAPSLFATTSFTSASLTAQGESPYPINNFQMYAPLVYKNYNGWNTGINIMNLSEIAPNQVTVQIFDQNGNTAGQYTVAVPAKGMQYIYIPTMSDLGTSSYGSAVLTSTVPFQAQVDEVKYSTDEAMSYIATAAGAVATPDGQPGTVHGNELSLPLFQNGYRDANSVQHGDTSGINLFNGGDGVINGHVNFYARDGSLANNLGSIPFTVGSLSQATIYGPNIATMSPNIDLSAEVVVDSGKGILTAVSNNVNYDVKGDGSTAFNLTNQWGQYRYVCSQTNCGFRVQLPDGTIVLLPPWSGGGPGTPTVAEHISLSPATQNMKVGGTAKVTATVTDAQNNAVKGAHVTFSVSGPNAGTASPGTQTATTDINGHANFSYTQSSPGQDTITATSTDLPSGVKATATVNWYSLSLTTTPGCAGTNPCALTLPVKSPGNNGQVTYTATLNGPDVSSIPVELDFSFKPANGGAAVTSTQHGLITVSGGTGTFSYTETQPNAGVDTVNAWADIDNLSLSKPADNDPTAGPVQVTWEFVATLAADPSFNPTVYNPWPTLDSSLYSGTDVIPAGKNVNLPVVIYGFNSSENVASGATAAVSLSGDHYSSPGSASTNTIDCSNANYCTAKINISQKTAGTDTANGLTLSNSGPGLTSGSATLQWYTMSSSVTPASPITVGNQATINISFNSGSQPLPNNIPIQLELSGPNFTGVSKHTLVTNNNAASYSYTGTIAGTDNYHAWLDINADGVFQSATEGDTSGSITWQAGKPDHINVALTGFTYNNAPYTASQLMSATFPIDGTATFTATVVDQYNNTVTTFNGPIDWTSVGTVNNPGGSLGAAQTNATAGVATNTLTDNTAETDKVTAALDSNSSIQGSTTITWVGDVNVELKIDHTAYIPFFFHSTPVPGYSQTNPNIGLIPANNKTTQLDVTITNTTGTTCPVLAGQTVHLVSGSRDITVTGSCTGNVWSGNATVDNNNGQNQTDIWTAEVQNTSNVAVHTSNPVTLYWYTVSMTTPTTPQTIGNPAQAAVTLKIDSGATNLPAGVPVQIATTTGANTTNVIANLQTLLTNGSNTLSTLVSSSTPGDQYLLAYVDTNANGALNVPDEGYANGVITWQFPNIPFNFLFGLTSVIQNSPGPAPYVDGGYLLPADGNGNNVTYSVAVTDQGGNPIQAGTQVCWVVNHSNDGGKTIAGQFHGSSQTVLDPASNQSTFTLTYTQLYAGEDTITAYFPGANSGCASTVPDNAPSGSTMVDMTPNIALSVESKYASTVQTDPPTALVPVGQTTVVNATVVGYTDANGANPMPGTMNLKNDTSLHDHNNGNVSVAFTRTGTACNNTSCQYVSGALGNSATVGSDLWQAELNITNQTGVVTVDSQNQALVQFYSVSLNQSNPASATVGSSITLGMTVDSGSRNLPDLTSIGWKTTAGPGAGTGTTSLLMGNASVVGPYTETTTGTQQFTTWVDTNGNGNLDSPQEGSTAGQVVWNPSGTTNIAVTFNGCAASQSGTPVLPTGNNVCQAGQYAFFTAHVTDANGNAVADGTTIYWQVENASGQTRSGAQYFATTTTANGNVSFSFSDTHVRQDVVRAFYSPTHNNPWNGTDVSGTNQVTWIAGPPNVVNVVLNSVTYNTGNGNAPVTANGDHNYPIMNAFGDTATFTVTVTDANNNVIKNQPVSLSIVHTNGNGGTTVSPAAVQCGSTDNNGQVTCSYVEPLAGSDVVTATAGSATGTANVGYDPTLVTAPSTQSIPLDGTSTGSASFTVYGYSSNQPIPANTGILLNVAGANPVTNRTLQPNNAGDHMTAWACTTSCVSTKSIYSTTSTHAGKDTWSTSLVLDNNPAAATIDVNWTPTLTVMLPGQLIDVDTNGNATWSYTITVNGYTQAEITNGTFAIDFSTLKIQGSGPALGSGSVKGNDATYFNGGAAWTCNGTSCTATYSNNNVNIGTAVIGSTYQITWTLTDPTGTALASPVAKTTISFRAAASGPPPAGPSLSVAVGPISGPYGTSYTVATNPGSWQYQFTVTGLSSTDLTGATLGYAPDTSSTFTESPGTISPDGPWTCSGTGASEVCTATFTINKFDVTSRLGTSEVLDWTLNYGTSKTLTGNTTTVKYQLGPNLAVAVGAVGGPYNPSYNITASPASWQYQFTVTGVQESDLANASLAFATTGSSTLTEAPGTIYTANHGSGLMLDHPAGSDAAGWTCTGSGASEVCTATFTINQFDVTGRDGKSEVLGWTLTYGASQTLSGNDTTVNYNLSQALGNSPSTFASVVGQVTENSPGPATQLADGSYLLPSDGNGDNLPYTVTVKDSSGHPVQQGWKICWFVTHTDGATSGVLPGQSGSATTNADGTITFTYTQVYAGQDQLTFYYDPSGAACGTAVPTGTGVTSGTAAPQTLAPNIAISFDADGSAYVSKIDATDALIPFTTPKQGLDFDVTVVGYTGASGVNPMYQALTVNSTSQTSGVPNVVKATKTNGACTTGSTAPAGTSATICRYMTTTKYGPNVGKVQTQSWAANLGSYTSQNTLTTQIYTIAIQPATTSTPAYNSVALTATMSSGGVNLPNGTPIDWTVASVPASGSPSTAVTSLMNNQAGYTDVSLSARADTITAWVDTNANTTLDSTEGSGTATVTFTAPVATNVSLTLLGCSATNGGTVSAPTSGGCTAGQWAEVQAYATDAGGNPVANGTTIHFQANRGSNQVATGQGTTTNGNAIFWYQNNTAGLDVVEGSPNSNMSSPTGSTTVTWTAGAAAKITLAANPTSQTVGTPVQLTATVTDTNNNPVAGETVTFSVTSANNASASFSNTSATTDSNGNAVVSYTNTKPGADTVQAADGVLNATTQVTWNLGQPHTLMLTASPNQQGINQNVTLTATVLDSQGNPLPGQVVHLKSQTGSISSIDTDLPATNNSGQATLVYSATKTGTDTIDATLGSLTSQATVTWINQASQYSLVVTPNPLIVQVDGTGTTQGYSFHLTLSGPGNVLNDLQANPGNYWFASYWTPQAGSPALPAAYTYAAYTGTQPNLQNISCSNGTCTMDFVVTGPISGLSANVGHSYTVTFDFFGTQNPGSTQPPTAPILASSNTGAYFQGPTGPAAGTPVSISFAPPQVMNTSGAVNPTNGGYTLDATGAGNQVTQPIIVHDSANNPVSGTLCWFLSPANGANPDHGTVTVTNGNGNIHYTAVYAGSQTLTVYYDPADPTGANCGSTVPSGAQSWTTTITQNPNIIVSLDSDASGFVSSVDATDALVPIVTPHHSVKVDVTVVGYTGTTGANPMTGTLTVDNATTTGAISPVSTGTVAGTCGSSPSTAMVCTYTSDPIGSATSAPRSDDWEATLTGGPTTLHSSNTVRTQFYTVSLATDPTSATTGSTVNLTMNVDSGNLNLPDNTLIGWQINSGPKNGNGYAPTMLANNSSTLTVGDAASITGKVTSAATNTFTAWVDTNGNGTLQSATEGSVAGTINWTVGTTNSIAVTFLGCSDTASNPTPPTLPGQCASGQYAFFQAHVEDAGGNAVSGQAIDFQINRGVTLWSNNAAVTNPNPANFQGTTNGSGDVTFSYQNGAAGTDIVYAYLPANSNNGNPPTFTGNPTTDPLGASNVTWTAGAAANVTLSLVNVTQTQNTGMLVGGSNNHYPIMGTLGDTANFTATVTDAHGNPVSGQNVTLAVGHTNTNYTPNLTGTTTIQCGQTDASGTVTCSYSESKAGQDTVGATAGSANTTTQVSINFDPSLSLTPTNQSLPLDGTTKAQLTATVYGYNTTGSPFPAQPLTTSPNLSVTGPNSVNLNVTPGSNGYPNWSCDVTSCSLTFSISQPSVTATETDTYTAQFEQDNNPKATAQVTWSTDLSVKQMTVTSPIGVQLDSSGNSANGWTWHFTVTGLANMNGTYFGIVWNPAGSPLNNGVIPFTDSHFQNVSCTGLTCNFDYVTGPVSGLLSRANTTATVDWSLYTSNPGSDALNPTVPAVATATSNVSFFGNPGAQPGTPAGFTFGNPTVDNTDTGPVSPTNGGYTLPNNGDPNTVHIGVTVNDPNGGNVPNNTQICWFVTVNGHVIDSGTESTSANVVQVNYQDNYAGQGTLTVYYTAGSCGTSVPAGSPSSTTTVTMNPNIAIALGTLNYSSASNNSLALMPLGKSMTFTVTIAGYTGTAGNNPTPSAPTVDNNTSLHGPTPTTTKTVGAPSCGGGTVCTYTTQSPDWGSAVVNPRSDSWQATFGSMHSSNQVETQIYIVTLSTPPANPTVGSSVVLTATFNAGNANLPTGTKIGWSVNDSTVAQDNLSGNTDMYSFTSTNPGAQNIRVWLDLNADSVYDAGTEGTATTTINWVAQAATNINVTFAGCSASQGGPAVMPAPPANACTAGDYAFFKAHVTDQNGNIIGSQPIYWQIERGTTFWSTNSDVTASTTYGFSGTTDVGGNIVFGEKNTAAGSDLITAFVNKTAASNPPVWDGTGPYGQSFVTWNAGAPEINHTTLELTGVTYVADPTTGPAVTGTVPGAGPFTSSIDDAQGNTAHFLIVLKDQYGNPIDPTTALANGYVTLTATNAGANVTCTTADPSTPDGIDCSYNTNLAGTDLVNAKYQGAQVGPTIQITWNPTLAISPSLLTITDTDTSQHSLTGTLYGYNSAQPISNTSTLGASPALSGFSYSTAGTFTCGTDSCTATDTIGRSGSGGAGDGSYTATFDVTNPPAAFPSITGSMHITVQP